MFNDYEKGVSHSYNLNKKQKTKNKKQKNKKTKENTPLERANQNHEASSFGNCNFDKVLYGGRARLDGFVKSLLPAH